jgi:hypothetical protein
MLDRSYGRGDLQGIAVVGDGYMRVESFLNLYNDLLAKEIRT